MFDPALQETFDQQRFERLKEAISEYLDDEGGQASKLVEDLQRAAMENVQYFAGRVEEYAKLHDALNLNHFQ